MVIKFWGTRGSIPVPGKDTLIFGGNTPCVQIKSADRYIILDAGTGVKNLGDLIIEERASKNIEVLLTHYHWDHIQGVPFFKPLYHKDFNVNFYGMSTEEYSIESVLKRQMDFSNFPIGMDQLKSRISFKSLFPGNKFSLGNLQVETFAANHPSPTIIYKFLSGLKSFIYMTDNELFLDQEGNTDTYRSFIQFCTGCDYLVHDAMFDRESEINLTGWGHSSNISVAEFALEAKIGNIILFHYNPDYSDDKINGLYRETVSYFKSKKSGINCIAAKEGLEMPV